MNSNEEPYIFVIGASYVDQWIKRSQRENVKVDIIDKFTCLWIAFNGWLKDRYGESRTDRFLINKAKENEVLKSQFDKLYRDDESFKQSINFLKDKEVVDMRDINDKTKYIMFDGTFESYIDILYKVRCNLFHGRKSARESSKDRFLMKKAYDTFSDLFINMLREINYLNDL